MREEVLCCVEPKRKLFGPNNQGVNGQKKNKERTFVGVPNSPLTNDYTTTRLLICGHGNSLASGLVIHINVISKKK